MKEQAAYSLLMLSGKTDISQSDVESFMTKCGVSADKDVMKALFAAMKETSMKDAIAAGQKKCVSMPSGGARAAGPAAGGAAAAEAAPKEEEKEEAEDVDMGGLFGDEDDGY
jgi:large subunit ribosomal protein LP2